MEQEVVFILLRRKKAWIQHESRLLIKEKIICLLSGLLKNPLIRLFTEGWLTLLRELDYVAAEPKMLLSVCYPKEV